MSAAAEPGPRSIIVKLKADGPHGVTGCAEWAWRQQQALAPRTRDGSDSLDRLREQLGVRSVRAVFRPSSRAPLAEQRLRLSQRLDSRRLARRARARAGALPDLSHVYRLELPPEVSAHEAAERYRADPHVVYAQPDFDVEIDRILDDPFLSSEGSWGQAFPDQWGVHAIDAPAAWDRTLGEGVVIGVVDTGVDYEHPDLAENAWLHPGEDLNQNGRIDPEERNGLDDDDNGFVDDFRGYDFHDEDSDPVDENGHGTHVAGIAAARGNNGMGIAGVAPHATVMPVRVFPPTGSASTAVVWRGVLYAALNGADVINGSFSCGTVCRSNPIAEEVIETLDRLGITYVTSAGNAASDVMLKSPERLRESVVVGAISPAGGLAVFSSFGLLVDVVAPGVEVLSLAAEAAADYYSPVRFVGDAYLWLSGTSQAAPHVSGVVALLKAMNPGLSPDTLRAALRVGALDLGVEGHDAVFGAGLVRPASAMAALPVPDVRGRIDTPLPGDTLDSFAPEFSVEGRASGADLAQLRLELGVGSDPEAWERLAVERGGDGSFRADLPLARLEDGAFVLRLAIDARQGDRLFEFTPFSIDRDRPVLMSGTGFDARRPAVYGHRVVWDAEDTTLEEAPGRELWTGRFGHEGQESLVEAPGDQTGAVVSRVAAVWVERDLEAGEPLPSTLRGCVGREPCRPVELTRDAVTRARPAISGWRVVYRAFDGRLHSCHLLRSEPCSRDPIDPAVSSENEPLLEGRHLVSSGIFEGARRLLSCRLDLEGACTFETLGTPVLAPNPQGLSRRHLAYTDVSLQEFALKLFVCPLDATRLECPPIEVATLDGVDSPEADLDHGRLVWHDRGAHGQRDIYFCEVDARRRACPVQALTNDAADQARPRIHRDRVVWEDQREGGSRIASIALPRLGLLRDRRVRAGQLLVIRIRARVPESAVRFSLHGDGASDPPPGARIVSGSRPERATLRWRPSSGELGTHWLTVRATLPSGIHTERSVRIEVLERLR